MFPGDSGSKFQIPDDISVTTYLTISKSPVFVNEEIHLPFKWSMFHCYLSKSKRLLCSPVFTSSYLSQSTCLCCVILACSGHVETLVSSPDDISHPALVMPELRPYQLLYIELTPNTVGQVYDLLSYCSSVFLCFLVKLPMQLRTYHLSCCCET